MTGLVISFLYQFAEEVLWITVVYVVSVKI